MQTSRPVLRVARLEPFLGACKSTDLLWMMLAIEVIIWQFDRIVEGFLPKVHEALTMHGVNSEYYAIQWWLG